MRRWGEDPALWPKLQRELQLGVPEGYKRCQKCEEVRPHSQYTPARRNSDGLQSYCHGCQAKNAMASWRRATPEQVERRRLRTALYDARRTYGEDGVKVAERRENGEGCDVCGRVTIRMAIDHCHSTGKVRGLLCKDCNLTLGIVEESTDRLRGLIAYIERHRD